MWSPRDVNAWRNEARSDITRYRYWGDVSMSGILIRDVPEDVLAVIDARAERVGFSRSEYLRRTLA